MKFVLIGGTVEALLLSLKLSTDHEVFIVEMEAEIGLPARHPGRVIDVQKLSNFFSTESIDFLSLQHNEHGWGCRWEWVSKHLAAKAARNNVTFLTRTRILSHQHTGEHHLLHLSHNERDFPHRLEVDHVVSMSKNALIGPGQRRHSIDLNDIQHYPFPPSRSWFGGTLPTSSLPTSIEADLVLSRSDGLTECWWSKSPTWHPPGGYIETCTVDLPEAVEEISFDAANRRSTSFATTFV